MSLQALYVGIGLYRSEEYDSLPSVNAATQLAQLLSKNEDGSPQWPAPDGPQGPVLLTSEGGRKVDETALGEAFDDLLTSSESEHVLFYFAGHGRLAKRKGRRRDLLLAAWDDDPGDPSAGKGLWASDMMAAIKSKHPTSATVILDCCHAGQAARGWGNSDPGIVLLAGAEADQDAISDPDPELPNFSRFLLEGLEAGAGDVQGRVTPMSLYTYVAGIMNAQKDGHVPVFKGEVQNQVTLRKVRATLSRIDLERLARTVVIDGEKVEPGFEGPDEKVAAEPAWETTDSTYHPPLSRSPDLDAAHMTAEQKLMEYYNRLIRAGLATTTDNKYLFWTVMASIDDPGKHHGVQLTPLGRYYWELSYRQQIGRFGD